MYVTGQAVNALAVIAERMARIVDPAVRASLTREYLELLAEYHSGRVSADFDKRVQLALSRSGFGQVSYKLTPALGHINDRFYRAYSDAAKSLERLEALARRQADARLRTKWEWFMKDIGQRLTQLHNEAEIASGNVNLSRLDALASEANNILAARLMPAEVEWGRALRQGVPNFVPRGASGAVSRAALPQVFAPGFTARPAKIEELKYPYARDRMRGQPGQGTVTRRYWQQGKRTGLAGILDSFKEVVTGAWDVAKGTAAATAGETEALYADAVKRLARARDQLAAQETELKRLQAAGGQVQALADSLAARRGRWDNARAELDGIAQALKSYSYDTLDTANQLVRSMLGQDETAAGTIPATWLLFRGQIEAARENVVKLERDNNAFEAELSAAESRAGMSPLPRAGAAVAGAGVLALAAGAAALLVLGRKRRG